MGKNVILIGAPGSGKGTQGDLLRSYYGFSHLSTGELLRQEVKKGSYAGRMMQTYGDKGSYVPDDIVMEVVAQAMEQARDRPGVVLDGAPRTRAQAEALQALLKKSGEKVDCVVEIVVEESLLLKRLSGRFLCAGCGANYNTYFCPPIREGRCDACDGSAFSRRPDDSPEVVGERLKAYALQTAPLISFYDSQGLLARVDGSLEREEVASQIRKSIDIGE